MRHTTAPTTPVELIRTAADYITSDNLSLHRALDRAAHPNGDEPLTDHHYALIADAEAILRDVLSVDDLHAWDAVHQHIPQTQRAHRINVAADLHAIRAIEASETATPVLIEETLCVVKESGRLRKESDRLCAEVDALREQIQRWRPGGQVIPIDDYDTWADPAARAAWAPRPLTAGSAA